MKTNLYQIEYKNILVIYKRSLEITEIIHLEMIFPQSAKMIDNLQLDH